MASSLALEIRAELDALQRDPEVVIPVARGVLFRMGGPFKHWEKGWYSINHLGGLVFSDGDDMRDAKPVLDHIVTASAVQCEQWKGASLMHAFQVMSSNGDARVLFCEDAVCRNHWVMTVNEAVRRSLALLGRPMQLADHYAIDYSSKLGSGLFAVVLRATDLKSGQSVAIKAIKPERFREHQPLIMREVSAWSTVGTHPRTVHLLGSFQSASRMYFVCELCPGGGLLSSLARNAAFCERDAARVMRQVLEGLAHIHARGVVHCDLKPENIITMSKADRADIKIADFGLSAFMGRPMQVGGTPEFVAPELLRDPEHFMGAGVGGEVDMWSAGVLLYYLLSGTTPFFASSFDKIVAKVQVGTWTFKGPAWAEVSAAAKDLVKILLCPLPDRRPSASQALANPWVAREGSAPTRVLATAVAAFRVQAREEASASGAEQEPQLPPMSSQRPSAPGLSLSAQPSPFSSPRVRAGSSMSGVPDRQLAPRPARPPRLGESSPFDAITERSQPVGSLFMWGEDASDGHVDAAICAMAGPRPAAVRRTGCIMSEYGAMAGSAQLDRATYGNSANNGVGAFDPPAHGRASCSGTYMTASGSFAMDSGSMTPQQFVASPMQSMSQAPMSPHCLYNVSVAGTEQRPSSQIVELQVQLAALRLAREQQCAAVNPASDARAPPVTERRGPHSLVGNESHASSALRRSVSFSPSFIPFSPSVLQAATTAGYHRTATTGPASGGYHRASTSGLASSGLHRSSTAGLASAGSNLSAVSGGEDGGMHGGYGMLGGGGGSGTHFWSGSSGLAGGSADSSVHGGGGGGMHGFVGAVAMQQLQQPGAAAAGQDDEGRGSSAAQITMLQAELEKLRQQVAASKGPASSPAS